MTTAVFCITALLLLAGVLSQGVVYAGQRDGAVRPTLTLKNRVPVVKMPPELAAPDKATLQVRSKQSDAAKSIIASGKILPRTRPNTTIIKFLDPKKPIPTPASAPWSVELTSSQLKTDAAYLEFTEPESTSGEAVRFAQKRSAILGTADGFFWPDSFASFGFAAKKDHGYLITVKAKKISAGIGSFVLFPVADGLGGGTMVTQEPQITALDSGEQNVLVERVVLIAKEGWYGYRIGLIAEGTWDLYSISIKEIDSILPD